MILYKDFGKEFDQTSHQLLIFNYGMRGATLNWTAIFSLFFPITHKLRIVCGGCTCIGSYIDTRILNGVPQDSVLGSVLGHNRFTFNPYVVVCG